MSFLAKLGLETERKEEECDHLYFPELDNNRQPIGQTCCLCGKFNSLDSLGIDLKRFKD